MFAREWVVAISQCRAYHNLDKAWRSWARDGLQMGGSACRAVRLNDISLPALGIINLRIWNFTHVTTSIGQTLGYKAE